MAGALNCAGRLGALPVYAAARGRVEARPVAAQARSLSTQKLSSRRPPARRAGPVCVAEAERANADAAFQRNLKYK